MAKSRADGTPAKGSTKKKAATPAKNPNAKSESPERRVTRSSPRRATLSTKAQEAAAAAEKVQAGRVVKKASPKKASLKKASPAKTKAQTPVKRAASPAKAETQTPPKRKHGRPSKASRATTPTTKASPDEELTEKQLQQVYDAVEAYEEGVNAASPAKTGGKKLNKKGAGKYGEQFPPHVVHGHNRATVSRILAPPPTEKGNFAAARAGGPSSDRSNGTPVPRDSDDIEKARIDRYEMNLTRWLENAPQDRTLREDTLSEGISLLKGAVAALGDHDAIGLPLDDPQTRRLRTICRETWMDLRKYFGTAFDDYLDKDIPDRVILRALLRVQGPQADGSMMGFNPERVWDLDNVVPLEYRDVVDLYGDYKRANQIESSPPRSPPRNGSEEQQGWWDYWEEHPESDHEGLPFIFSQAAAQDAKRLQEHAHGFANKTSASPGKARTTSSVPAPAHRPVSDILADAPKGRFPIPRRDEDDEELHPYYLRRSYRYAHLIGGSETKAMKKATNEMQEWLAHGLEEPPVDLYSAYDMLAEGVGNLARYDDLGVNIVPVRRLRSACRKLWMTLRRIVGSAVDECLDKHVPGQVFEEALAGVQRPMKEFEVDTTSDPSNVVYRFGWHVNDTVQLKFGDVAELFEKYKRKEEGRKVRHRGASPAKKRTRSKSPVTAPAPVQADGEPEEVEAGPISQRTGRLRAAQAEAKRTASKSPAPIIAAAPPPPSGRTQSRSPIKPVASPRKSNSASNTSAKAGSTHESDRGLIISPTNLPKIPVLNAESRFFETLPAPEVWHRRMAPYFTFGETPHVQKLASDQIQDDLQRNTDDRAKAAKAKEGVWKKATSIIGSIGGSINDRLYGSPAKQPNGYPSPWDLPEVTKQEVKQAMGRKRRAPSQRIDADLGSRPSSHKKPSSPNKPSSSPRKKPVSPRKIPQREAEDEDVTDEDGDYVMSSGLH